MIKQEAIIYFEKGKTKSVKFIGNIAVKEKGGCLFDR